MDAILRKLGILFVLLLLAALPARATIALVNHTFASAASASSVTTSGINTSGATLLVVVANNYAAAPPAITDSLGNTWTALTVHAGTNARTQIVYAVNPTVGASQTFTGTGGSYPTIFVTAWSGTLTTSAVFDAQSGAGATDTTHSTPGSITPAGSGELFITGVAAANSNSLSFSASPGGFTNIDTQPTGLTYTGGAIAYVVNSGSGALNPTWTVTNGDGPGSAMAAFKPSGGAPPCANSIALLGAGCE